jgi:hypothetical protein
MNRDKINKAADMGVLKVIYKSNLLSVDRNQVILDIENEKINVKNDLVYIFAGGELPTDFLQKAGVQITKRFGYTLKKHG